MTQWVSAEAWESIHKELQPTIQRSFCRCGITVTIDGSEDDQINIRGLNNYQVPQSIDPLVLEDHLDSNLDQPSDSSDSSNGPSDPLRPLVLILQSVYSRQL